jgi:hypothetical protein
MVFDMKTKTKLCVCGVILILIGIFLAHLVMGQAWAVGLLVAGLVVTLLVEGLISGVADRDLFILSVAVFVIVCIGWVLYGGVAQIILQALGGSVTSSMFAATSLTGVGGVLLGIGSVQE